VPTATPFIALSTIIHEAEKEIAVMKESTIAMGKNNRVNVRETSMFTPSPRLTYNTGNAIPEPRATRTLP